MVDNHRGRDGETMGKTSAEQDWKASSRACCGAGLNHGDNAASIVSPYMHIRAENAVSHEPVLIR